MKPPTIPSRRDIELEVIGAMFNFPESIATSGATERCFHQEHLRRAFLALKTRGSDVTAITHLLNEQELETVATVWTSVNIQSQVKELYALDFARTAFESLRNCVESFDINDPAEFRESIAEHLQQITRAMGSNGIVELKSTNDAGRIYREYLEKCVAISCGIDSRLKLRPGQTLLIGARPGTGKTALLAQVMANIAANEPGDPIIYSMEMDAGEIFHRLACHSAGRYLRPESPDALQWIDNLPRFLNGKEILIVDEASQAMSQIEAHAASVCAGRKVSAIGIDYASLIENSAKERRHEAMADVSRRIKIMSRNLNVPVICLVQLTKDSNEKPTLSSIAESDGFARDANQVWILWLEKAEDQHKTPTPTMLEILKNRGGHTGGIPLDFHKESMAFKTRAL